jgi:hypothetical protein
MSESDYCEVNIILNDCETRFETIVELNVNKGSSFPTSPNS